MIVIRHRMRFPGASREGGTPKTESLCVAPWKEEEER